ncbi:transcriptional regulator, MerR family [Kribbella flavida DSM 17836]|uniref:Transcriptional regulator, MerR family n=1 Tax=Kribbella flavida (strain DSM 17836 / JCM 10339 / NBRC 14399) TaxID=479435 RepID=D2PYE5_KRIFD|nr:MerR family transcriptional regulator [Kribbella flavida]ADB35513.1 transcriptional regulator, MerR family [Kribbella flavida DSM 17836]
MTYSIGELARRTGLSVKTIRFYSDRGVVPPTGRTSAGYRQYDAEALARLELIRTLRDLGLPLATIQQVLQREHSLAEVAAAEADALEVQIRALRVRQAVLRSAALSPERLHELQRLAALTAAERTTLVEGFLESVFADPRPSLAAARQTMRPALPDNATVQQLEAWLELGSLCQDSDFRDLLRQLVKNVPADGVPRPDAVAVVRDRVAQLDGLSPDSPAAAAIVVELGPLDIDHLRLASDPRRQRYVELLAVLNDWPAPTDPTPALNWYLAAARA